MYQLVVLGSHCLLSSTLEKNAKLRTFFDQQVFMWLIHSAVHVALGIWQLGQFFKFFLFATCH